MFTVASLAEHCREESGGRGMLWCASAPEFSPSQSLMSEEPLAECVWQASVYV